MESKEQNSPEEAPPILGSWRRLYLFLLLAQVVIITVFALITSIYS